jgi:phage tail-like protein
MPTDARAINRLKEFKFRVEINGYPAALCHEFNPGERSHGVSSHAGAGQNFAVKEVGMINFGNCTLRQVVPLEGPGRHYFDTWMNQGQDPMTGNGGIPADYARNFTLYELDPYGNPSRAWEYYGAFPVRYVPGNRNAQSDSADVVEEIELAYSSRDLRLI